MQKANLSLRQSNDRLSQLLEATPVCIYTCEADGTYGVRFMGNSAYEITGYTPEMFTATSSFWPEHIHPDDVNRVFGDKTALFETGRHEDTYRFQVADGSYKWFQYFTQIIKKLDGHPDCIIGVWADVTKQKQAEEKIHSLAYYGDLTGLPNRVLLHDRLEETVQFAKKKNRPVALLMMDLDRFREINDTLGHHRGDVLIKEVAARLEGVLFENDLVARMGGDEFALIAPLSESDHAGTLVNKILKVLEAPFFIEKMPVSIEASIGISYFPDHGLDVKSLIQHADVAMYIAKEKKQGYVIYDSTRDKHDPRHLALMSELRSAIEKDELALHYQPKIDLKTKQVIGLEALLRWKHPEWGHDSD